MQMTRWRKTALTIVAVAGLCAAEERLARACPPEITTTVGPSGVVQVTSTAVVGDFYEATTIIRSSRAPDCVATIHSDGQALSDAGTLSLSSELVGTDAGLPTPIVIPRDTRGEYFAEFAPFSDTPNPYDFHDSVEVQLSASGAPGLPAFTVERLQSPAYDTIHVTAPVVPESGELTLSSGTPVVASWQPPVLDACVSQRVWLYLFAIVGQGKVGSISCHYPLSAGAGQIPAELLTALSDGIDNPGVAPGAITLLVGDVTEVTTDGASYTIVVSDDDPDGDGIGITADGVLSTNVTLVR